METKDIKKFVKPFVLSVPWVFCTWLFNFLSFPWKLDNLCFHNFYSLLTLFFKFLGLWGHLFNEIHCNPGAMQTLDRTGNNLLMKNKIPIKMIKCNLIISIIIQAVSKIYYSNLKNQNLFHQSSLLIKLPYMFVFYLEQ